MMIELKYRLSGSVTEYTMQFDAVFARPVPSVARLAYQTLRAVEGRHQTSTRKNYDVFISADQFLTTERRDFAKAYMIESVRWWIRIQNDDGSWPSYVEVAHEKDGDFSATFIEDVDALMELRFRMIQKYPD